MSAFRRQVAEAVSLKMGASDKRQYLVNEKWEYNRSLVPDIMEPKTPEQSELLSKISKENIKTKKLWDK